jgi:hypothetical protein
MARQEKDDEKTRIQPPVRSVKKKIPARFRASIVIVEATLRAWSIRSKNIDRAWTG